ncbi:unnamed protein product [Spodoptera exigua]|nr:unnamed protein product [Spodoptera exigua]
MSLISISNSLPPFLSNNIKVLTLEKTLLQGLDNFKDLLSDFEQLQIESNNYKTQFIEQKEKCGSNSCSSAEALKRIIESKDTIIQLVASTLTRLNETKDLKILDEAFRILFGEAPTSVPTYQDSKEVNKSQLKQELHSSLEDVSFREESESEIEGTPTAGRISPIIPIKKLKGTTAVTTSSDFRDKKKCPDNWATPEKKAFKLSCSTPVGGKKTGRYKQSRLNLVKVEQQTVIDITCSPEFSGGRRDDSDKDKPLLIKKESIENEDTILPSPTSGPNNFTLFKSKESPMKFKKPLSLKVKTEKTTPPKKLDQSVSPSIIKQELNTENVLRNNVNDSVTFTQEDSINLLHPNRLPKNLAKHAAVKAEQYNDETYCDTQASVSLLQHVDKLDNIHKRKGNSPSKSPLAENINLTNIQDDDELQASMSVLQREPFTKNAVENVKRKIPELVEMDHEPVRKKSEKRLLPGWSCEKCKDFFGELYKDDPEMMAKKINECSHHRGANNPTDRPKTPPRYWNPRWEVPNDTEEFNRMNNVS